MKQRFEQTTFIKPLDNKINMNILFQQNKKASIF